MTTPTRRTSRVLAAVGVAAIAVALSVVAASPAYANVFIATDAASLSAAITAANTNPGVDTIRIQPALPGNTITMSAANPQVTGPIIVTGDPSNPPTIVGPTVAAPIFQVVDPTANFELDDVNMAGIPATGDAITFVSSSGTVTLNHDTFTNFPHPAVELLLHTGNLIVSDSTFSGNSSLAADADGGAITAGSVHDVTIVNSTFSNNTANHHGGALFFGDANSVNISGTTFTGNSAADDGGAIEITTLAADSAWQNDTFTNNTAGGTAVIGGAAFMVGSVEASTSLDIDQSTFTGNIGNTSGFPVSGGVGYVRTANGTVQLSNSTMTGNTLVAGSGNGLDLAVIGITSTGELDIVQSTLDETGAAANLLFVANNAGFLRIASSTVIGPGVLQVVTNSNIAVNAVEVRDTIAVSNTGTPAFNVAGTPAIIGYSITSDAANAQLVGLLGMHFGVTDPQLGPLANNGGPTQTRLPLAGSLAIDAGDPAFSGLTTDQRGAGFPRVNNGRVDIGSVEAISTTAPTLAATGTDPAQAVWSAATTMAAGLLLLGALVLLRRRNTAQQSASRR